MKFKTNAKCAGCEAAIRMKLNGVLPESDWNIDLDSPDKVLTVKGDVAASAIISAVEDAGFRIEQID